MTRQQGSASFLEKREEKKQPRMSEMFGNALGCFFDFHELSKRGKRRCLG